MDEIAMDRSGWELMRSVGMLKGGVISGRVDVMRPELGVRDLHVEGSQLDGQWFCVRRDAAAMSLSAATTAERDWPLPVADAYIRGNDLVASYESTTDWPYAPQIYWRAGQLDCVAGVVGSLSLLVSVQTHLLDTCPRIVVESVNRAQQAVLLTVGSGERTESVAIGREMTVRASAGVCCVLRRLAGQSLSYAEFVPASDFRTAQAGQSDNGDCRAEWQMFAEFLEKGVIRRARLHGAFLRREDDLDAAVACCRAIERESLPLTT